MPITNPKGLTGLQPIDIPLTGGLSVVPSRLYAPHGTLTDCVNFEVVDGAYEESQGLTLVGPTLSEGLVDFWHADVTAADVTAVGTFTAGDYIFWYDDDGYTTIGSGRMYYADVAGSNVILTIDRITGRSPRRATSLYTSNGATLVIGAPSSESNTFTKQENLGLSWDDYTGGQYLGALITEQTVTSATC